MKKNIIYTTMFLFFITFISCDDEEGYEEYNVAMLEAAELSGDWYVSLYEDGTDLTGYYLLTTSNTAANNNIIWIDDHGALDGFLFPLKVEATANIASLTFAASDAENLYDEDASATITDGKILKDAGFGSVTRATTDSIAFTIQVANNPATYLVAGHKITGFLEDEH